MNSHEGGVAPHISVLMPTFRHAPFIWRALESLRAQTLTDWELIIVDDGSPDDTAQRVAAFGPDERIRYHRLERNGGLGAALNTATARARGRYLAYLPSDDLFYADHLARLAALLDADPTIYLAYGGLRWGYHQAGMVAYRRLDSLARWEPAPEPPEPSALPPLLMVQTLHRRDHEAMVRWATRVEVVSDRLEDDFWQGLAEQGARFACSGAISCEWVDHPDQRHRIIAGPTGGLARYRSYYGVGRGEWLNWQPAYGIKVDERARYGRFATRRDLPAPGGLKILLVGELGFNPERMLAFEERGHKLYGLWVRQPESWDTTGPLAYGNIDDIPADRDWPARVRALRPDVIYALLNWQALPLIEEVLDAQLGIPLVFHFKEGPFICHERGLWPALMRVLSASAGQIFINAECRDWFQLAAGPLDPEWTLILDGDLPKADWMTGDWAPKRSARDGQIHTVCPGRPLGLDPFEAIAEAGIHVHFYGQHFQRQFPNWTRRGLATGFMHLYPTVEPADWVRELSQYDAAWFHIFDSANGGDLRRATWDDLNLPARMGSFAAAGLPWILKDNRHSQVAIQSLAQRYDIGVFFRDFADLACQLNNRDRIAQLTANMRAARHHFAFDTHVDALVALFRRLMARAAH